MQKLQMAAALAIDKLFRSKNPRETEPERGGHYRLLIRFTAPLRRCGTADNRPAAATQNRTRYNRRPDVQ